MPPVPHTPAAGARDHAALVVALDAGDVAADERERAEALVVTCAGCAALAVDLVAIREAMTVLPVPPRRRDFRLTDADAARLRPSRWHRLVGWLAAPRSSVRPLATGLATLGVVGLLLTAGLPGFGPGGMTTLTATGAPAEAPVAVQNEDGDGQTPNPHVLQPDGSPAAGEGPAFAGEGASAAPTAERSAASGAPQDTSGTKAGEAARPPDGAIPLSLALSVVLLAGGLGLLLARAIAVRRA